jgi:NAD-dependent deacetylase
VTHALPGLAAAREAFHAARFVLVLTGAGVSAESGVPTFRGAGGYWRRHHFSELATPEAFARDPRLVWDWYLERRATVRLCQPNAAHRALADWARRAAAREGPGGMLVTQNVDGLHERAGHDPTVRIHGSLWRARCAACEAERDDAALAYPQLPRCPACGGAERPAVVWFGEAIPSGAATAAAAAAHEADCVLVVGTAGVVYPAAGFVEDARDRGASVIEINPDEDYGRGPHGAFGGTWLRAGAATAVPALLTASS